MSQAASHQVSASSGWTKMLVNAPSFPLRIADEEDGILVREHGSWLGVHRGAGPARTGTQKVLHLVTLTIHFWVQKLKRKGTESQIDVTLGESAQMSVWYCSFIAEAEAWTGAPEKPRRPWKNARWAHSLWPKILDGEDVNGRKSSSNNEYVPKLFCSELFLI